MIDLSLQLQSIEKIMELMAKHEVDEVSVDFLQIKKTRFKIEKQDLSDKEKLDEYAKPLPSEPWAAISDQELDQWSINRK